MVPIVVGIILIFFIGYKISEYKEKKQRKEKQLYWQQERERIERERHDCDMQPVQGKCLEKCSICGIERDNHNWNHCTCRACGIVNPNHDFKAIPNICGKSRCSVCGTEINDDDVHNWVHLHNCRKKCSICGIIAYDHDYKCTHSRKYVYNKYDYNSDGEHADYYNCKKCGHEAKIVTYLRNNYSDDDYYSDDNSFTLQVGRVIE